jgi:N-methylhydantoinase A
MVSNQRRIGVDVGGTFTDLVVLEPDGELRVEKVPTTPEDQSQGFIHALDRASFEPDTEIVHGTTVGTNAILERRGAQTALITTAGFRDVLELQNQERSRIWDLAYVKTPPLIPRECCFEVTERLDVHGNVVTPLDARGLARTAQRLRDTGTDAVAICLLHAYRNGEHEDAVADAIEDVDPDLYTVVSSRLAPQFREYDRASTTVMSAYIGPVVSRYLLRLRESLTERSVRGELLVMQSNGGVLPAERSSRTAIGTALSGPAGGVMAARFMGELAGRPDVIAFDMGGTSTDVSLIADGRPQVASRSLIAGLPVITPMFRIDTVGAGGGSIARVDSGGLLRVGPESAGSMPGPVCYGRGAEQPTVTDALVTLGIVGARQPLSDAVPLDAAAALSALAELGERLGMSARAAAEAVVRVADHTMAQAVRRVSLNQGHDPRDFALVAFGGAGPAHAARVADELRIAHVIVPPNAGVFSAIGLLCTDRRTDQVFSDLTPLDALDDDGLAAKLRGYVERARDRDGDGDEGGLHAIVALDLRYVEQDYSLTIPVDGSGVAQVLADFHRTHEQRYGFSEPEATVEIVNVRIALVRPRRKVERIRQAASRTTREREHRPIHLDGAEQRCLFLSRASLATGETVAGPAVVEEPTTTTFVPAGWYAEADDQHVLHLRQREA